MGLFSYHNDQPFIKMKLYLSIFVFTIILLQGCTTPNSPKVSGYQLTESEKAICDSFGFDQGIFRLIRIYNDHKIEPFHYSLGKTYVNGVQTESDPIHLRGLVFTEKNAKSYDLIFNLKDNFRANGYSIFLLENNFNIDNEPDHIGVLKTTDKYAVLKQIVTNGINYDIDNDSLISIIKSFDKKYALELIGASGDWCEFIIHNENTDWMQLAKEAYKVCPDIVDQGAGTIKELAEEMKRTGRLYFWWD